MRRTHAIAATGALTIVGAAPGQITSLDLGNYVHSATYPLPSVAASEASAVTYNWDTGTLFVLGDEGEAIVEVSKTGEQLSTMSLLGFDDTEGITYIGGGQFVVVEEREQDLFRLTYVPGGSVSRGSLDTASIGPDVGNSGLEGVSYDPRSGNFLMVKEKNPQGVYDTPVTFTPPPAGPDINPPLLFDPLPLGLSDLSGIQALSTVPSLLGTADEGNMLIYSQESRLLLEVSPAGETLSSFSFLAIAADAEGVTIDNEGVIYIVGEQPEMYVLTPRCYADCDRSSSLDFFDFLCFQNLFAAGDPGADCDESGELDFFDFLCFQDAFAAGCP